MTDDQGPVAPMRGIGRKKVDEHGVPIGDHRCTPPEIWQLCLDARRIEGFDLDPASNEHSTVPALVRYTGPKVGGEDGLALPWWGNVWLNFPFSDPVSWVEKVQREADRMMGPTPDERAPHSMTVLGPGDSSVTWWRAMRQVCDARALWPTRPHFSLPGQPTGQPPGPVHVWYFGPRATLWRRVLEGHGVPTEGGAVW